MSTNSIMPAYLIYLLMIHNLGQKVNEKENAPPISRRGVCQLIRR